VFIYRGEEEEVPQKWKKKEENFFIFYLMRLRRPDSLFLFAPPPPSYAYYKYLYNTGVRTRPHALIGSAFVEYKANKKREKKEKG
jgi:hypothetical protein